LARNKPAVIFRAGCPGLSGEGFEITVKPGRHTRLFSGPLLPLMRIIYEFIQFGHIYRLNNEHFILDPLEVALNWERKVAQENFQSVIDMDR
jgi:hypothetical protein